MMRNETYESPFMGKHQPRNYAEIPGISAPFYPARFLHAEEVIGSSPVSPTHNHAGAGFFVPSHWGSNPANLSVSCVKLFFKPKDHPIGSPAQRTVLRLHHERALYSRPVP